MFNARIVMCPFAGDVRYKVNRMSCSSFLAYSHNSFIFKPIFAYTCTKARFHPGRSCAYAKQAALRWDMFLEKHGDASTISRLVNIAADKLYFREGVLSGAYLDVFTINQV
jgi:hypothetical protein